MEYDLEADSSRPSDSEVSSPSDVGDVDEGEDLVYPGENHCRVAQLSKVGATCWKSVCPQLKTVEPPVWF